MSWIAWTAAHWQIPRGRLPSVQCNVIPVGHYRAFWSRTNSEEVHTIRANLPVLPNRLFRTFLFHHFHYIIHSLHNWLLINSSPFNRQKRTFVRLPSLVSTLNLTKRTHNCKVPLLLLLLQRKKKVEKKTDYSLRTRQDSAQRREDCGVLTCWNHIISLSVSILLLQLL